MTEEEGRAWLMEQPNVSRETLDQLDRFIALLLRAADSQNLISARDRESIWARHVVDSAQLAALGPDEGEWADLGTGAGFPGMVLAILDVGPVTLIEERRKRAVFLAEVAAALDLPHVTVVHGATERLAPARFRCITARAFAPAPRLFDAAHHLAAPGARWLLPKGRSAAMELEEVAKAWQGDFKLERSVTDPESAILIADRVTRRMSA